jgi:hypothetical protein
MLRAAGGVCGVCGTSSPVDRGAALLSAANGVAAVAGARRRAVREARRASRRASAQGSPAHRGSNCGASTSASAATPLQARCTQMRTLQLSRRRRAWREHARPLSRALTLRCAAAPSLARAARTARNRRACGSRARHTAHEAHSTLVKTSSARGVRGGEQVAVPADSLAPSLARCRAAAALSAALRRGAAARGSGCLGTAQTAARRARAAWLAHAPLALLRVRVTFGSARSRWALPCAAGCFGTASPPWWRT